MPNVAINGLGRIGRAALKILLDADGLDLVAVNDIADVDNLAYLLRYDTVYGRYQRKVGSADGALLIDGRRIAVFAERDPANLPWAGLAVDLVLECTGLQKREDLKKHIHAGASFVILSAPTSAKTVPTVVHGVNHHRPFPAQAVPRTASPPYSGLMLPMVARVAGGTLAPRAVEVDELADPGSHAPQSTHSSGCMYRAGAHS
jgi:glyceraldehyde 3-phosphate dehydrogenase